jgi:hypothetical protein
MLVLRFYRAGIHCSFSDTLSTTARATITGTLFSPSSTSIANLEDMAALDGRASFFICQERYRSDHVLEGEIRYGLSCVRR